MGGGFYSSIGRTARATTEGYSSKNRKEIFTQKSICKNMDPKDLKIRESRDSTEHPNSVPIILGLDVTGSMGNVPHEMIINGLPTIMSGIIQRGIQDPQLLILGIGDHECDKHPLQVSQFESSDELLDKWLTSIYLEGGGGGNDGESYLLAWYLAAFHTEHDAWEKRKKKGYLFTVGDEPTLTQIPRYALQELMGNGQYSDLTYSEILNKARERYHVYHINLTETHSGSRDVVAEKWHQILGENLIMVNDHREIAKVIAEIICNNELNTTKETKLDVPVNNTNIDITNTEDVDVL